jgi:Flp pilus assembly secretin CpaC
VATPTILPDDMVRVRLHPRFTVREGEYIDVAAMETDVVVANGQSLVIGGLEQASDDVGAALFSYGRRQEERRVLLTVTPHIHGAP